MATVPTEKTKKSAAKRATKRKPVAAKPIATAAKSAPVATPKVEARPVAAAPAPVAPKVEAAAATAPTTVTAKAEAAPVSAPAPTTPKVEPAAAQTPVTAPKVEATPVAAAAPATKVKATPVVPAAAPASKIEAKPVAVAKAPATKTVPPKAVKTSEVKPKPTIAAKPASKGRTKMTDTVKQVEDTVKKATAEATEKATAMFNDINTRAKTAMEKAGAASKDVVEFHKANLEAFVEAGKIAAKGVQTAAQSAADYSRKNFEATTAMFKSAAAVKSPTELFKLQGEFARGQFDGAVAEVSKSTEYSLKLAGEIVKPIQSRYAVVAENMKTRLAA